MENKLVVIISIPELDKNFDMLIPMNKKVGNIIEMIAEFLKEETDGKYELDLKKCLYDSTNGVRYDINTYVIDTNIQNGSKLILI